MTRLIACLLARVGAAPAQGQVLERLLPLDGAARQGPAFLLAQAEQVVTLARSVEDVAVSAYPGQPAPSDLRVSLVVLQTSTTRGMNPRRALHLAVFNDIRGYGIAWALEPVASVHRVDAVAPTAPGIFEVRAIVGSGKPGPNCVLTDAVIRVDARALSDVVRRAEGLAQHETRRYSADMPVTLAAGSGDCVQHAY